MLRGVPFILALLVVLGLTALASGWVYNPTGQTCDQVCEGKGFCREFALDAVNTKEEVDAIGIELSLSSCVRKAIFANLLTNQEATCLDVSFCFLPRFLASVRENSSWLAGDGGQVSLLLQRVLQRARSEHHRIVPTIDHYGSSLSSDQSFDE
eukprot:m.54854 g.54854  ORF g.54854 m.54854 type:complete len:153 (-) comp48811_c0_seq8:98-556(-)